MKQQVEIIKHRLFFLPCESDVKLGRDGGQEAGNEAGQGPGMGP